MIPADSAGRGRYLIVNADDFGQSEGVNAGVALCHETGIVTSASLMVRWQAARQAAEYAARHPALAVGIHLDFCEWTCEDNRWFPLYEVVSLDDERAVRQEVERQLGAFRSLMGCNPTHLDSHQHAHDQEPARQALLELASALDVPLRGWHPRVRYVGSFYGQGKNARPLRSSISSDHLLDVLARLPDGITELGCHPAVGRDLQSVYLEEREREVAVLCDPRVRQAIEAQHITLMSFREAAVLLKANMSYERDVQTNR